MADEELVEVARAAADAYLDANLDRAVNWSFDGDEFADTVREAVLKRLAERGRLVPDGGLTRTEWAVTTPKGKQIHTCYDEAEARTTAIYGRRRVVVSRQVTNWPDGTRLTGPWVAVAEEPADG